MKVNKAPGEAPEAAAGDMNPNKRQGKEMSYKLRGPRQGEGYSESNN